MSSRPGLPCSLGGTGEGSLWSHCRHRGQLKLRMWGETLKARGCQGRWICLASQKRGHLTSALNLPFEASLCSSPGRSEASRGLGTPLPSPFLFPGRSKGNSCAGGRGRVVLPTPNPPTHTGCFCPALLPPAPVKKGLDAFCRLGGGGTISHWWFSFSLKEKSSVRE